MKVQTSSMTPSVLASRSSTSVPQRPMHSFTPSLVTSSLLVLGLIAFTACSPGAAQSEPAGPPPAPAVGVEKVEVLPLVEYAELTGRLGPVESVEVRPRISGYVEDVLFQAGEIVEKDQVLFRVDARWNKAEVARREADLAAEDTRLAIAEREGARASKLVDSKAISAEEAEARASRILEARATQASKKAELTSARLDLEYTEIRAPIRGRISRALVTKGNFISGVAGSNTQLATIVSVDPVYFYADLDESTYLRFDRLARESMAANKPIRVELGLSDEPGFPRAGTLESLDNQLDRESGTILLRATFANGDGRLLPGLFARARVPIGDAHDALCIDDRAVGTDQNQKFVLTIGAGDVAEYRKVKLGPVHAGRRVVLEGLSADDRVIVTGLQKVRPGMPVKPEAPSTATASAQR